MTTQRIQGVVFSADTQTIISAADDGKIQIWLVAEH
jgi:WD40 repeat protein